MITTLIAALAVQTPVPVNGITAIVRQVGGIVDSTNIDVSPMMAKHPVIYVEFSNSSHKTVTLLKENCSWGYEMLSFEWINGSGDRHSIGRVPRPWWKNVPIPMPIGPGHCVLRGVDLYDGTWSGAPIRKAEPVSIRAILNIEPGFLIDGKYWQGRFVSDWSRLDLSFTPSS